MNNEILRELLAQEDEIQLAFFNNQTAWELGNLLKLAADKLSAPIAIEVYAFERLSMCYLLILCRAPTKTITNG
jgi:uncharacterized protein (UPF0303 family)